MPKHNEWWEDRDGNLVYVCGFDTDGDPVFVCRSGEPKSMSMALFLDTHRHMPDCTSWGWNPKPKQPKRVPVRLYWYDGNIVGRYDHSPPTDPSFQELFHDENGFYTLREN